MRVVLLALSILLAGCSSTSGGPDAEEGFDGNVEETIDDAVAGHTDRGAVAGTVRNVNGAQLDAAQVLLMGRSGTTQTGVDGRFEIRDVAPGLHTLRVDRAGYRSLERDITVVAGKVTRLNVTLADQFTGDPGFREHLHDRWRGATSLTLFDGTVRHDHAYMPGGSYLLPCFTGLGFNTAGGNNCFRIPLLLGEETVVPVGTERLMFTADWDKTDFVPEVRLLYQPANETEFRASPPIAPGQEIEIQVRHPMPDHGHQLHSMWSFALEARPTVGSAALGSQYLNEHIAGDFSATLSAYKGTVPPEAPHPRYWADGDTVVVVEALEHHVAGLPRDRDPTRTACEDTLPCFVLPAGSLVPPGTTRLQVVLEYAPDTPAAEPVMSRKTIGFRTSAVWAPEATLDDLRAEPPVEIEFGRTVYELEIGEGEADPFYQGRSSWLFLLAHEGDERGDQFVEDCYGLVFGCGGSTYTLRVVAINDDWTPDLAGIE